MFQYAFGKALSLDRKEQLYLDTTGYEHQARIDTPRSYGLDVFNIKAEYATPEMTAPFNTKSAIFWRKVKRRLLRLSDYEYHSSVVHSRGHFFEGFWSTERYFKQHADQIRADLTLKDALGADAAAIEKEILDAKQGGFVPVAIHVRRGDYISNPYAAAAHSTVGIDYYENALAALYEQMSKAGLSKDKVRFFIFSDEISWVEQNIPHISGTYVSRPSIKDAEEIHLMSICSHYIIANSSFSWWGAWLNPNPDKIVVAPLKWVNNPYMNTRDVCPPEWIRA